MNASFLRYVMPALISAVAALATALITLASSRGDLKAARDLTNSAVEQAQALRSSLAVPVGSVVPSLLSPLEFSNTVGDPPQFHPKESLWTLADGKEAAGTRYADVTRRSSVPDLRGLFLRGLNVGRQDYLTAGDPDGAARVPGGVQSDELEAHSHEIPHTIQVYQGGEGGFKSIDRGPDNNISKPHTANSGEGEETRPRNAAVYYYVRVNDVRIR